jgi:hypothetical protein
MSITHQEISEQEEEKVEQKSMSEFGNLPKTIARTAQKILKDHAFPKLFNQFNWIEEEIKWSTFD